MNVTVFYSPFFKSSSAVKPVLVLVLFWFFSMPFLSAQISKPEWTGDLGARTFPDKKLVVKVNDYGAFRNEFIASTEAIQKAIDTCSAQGGGMVVFEPGVYHTGALFLKNNVNLNIGEGVELRALIGLEYYPEIKTRVAGIIMNWPCGVINILDQQNVAITGKGVLHAQGKIHWERYWNLRHEYTPKGLRWASDYDCKRVRTIEVSNCKDITIKDITIKQSGFWTVHLFFTEYATVDGITIRNNIDGFGPSTDGVDIDSSVKIEVMNCDVDCNDDNYCVKAGRDADGIRVNRPSEYVYIHDCIARRGGGALVIGSETSGWIRHVFVENIKAIGTKNVIYLKSAKTRGGGIEDIRMTNVVAHGVRDFCGVTVNWNPSYSYAKLEKEMDSIPAHWKIMLQEVPEEIGIPHIRNVEVSNIKADSIRGTAFNIQGIEKSIIKNFTFSDLQLSSERTGIINWADGIKFDNVTLKTAGNDELTVKNSRHISTKGLKIERVN
ncbi:glycoside hydrolase family 28 protein [Saccharicrinis sp. FJH54]|uniref:glycoside hydrolase family 28 protein n=1 Tax=Saccharicrinis sp. FJH54 TaxID=3344665 RepID=UPI0035D4FC4C